MYELASGPLALGAALIFLLGLVYQTVRFFWLTKPVARPARTYKPQPGSKTGLQPSHRLQRTAVVQRTVLGMEPGLVVVTTLFHLLLILTPLTVLGHVLLVDASWGIRLPAISEATSDLLTVLVLALGGYLLYRRISVAQARSITGSVDLLILAIVLMPYLTGFLAYHQWLPYRPIIVAHILSGELLLVCIPFTRLAHALFFFLTRLCLGSEYSFTRGNRTWR